jgi:predicted nucleic acid-binding protein
MYLDAAYLAKFYVHEPESVEVRALMQTAPRVSSSAWSIPEVTCAFQRHVRQGYLTVAQGEELIDLFAHHCESGVWQLVPVTDSILRTTRLLIRSVASTVPLRAGDAIHLATAISIGESELWTNDRHLLAATHAAGLTGRHVDSR